MVSVQSDPSEVGSPFNGRFNGKENEKMMNMKFKITKVSSGAFVGMYRITDRKSGDVLDYAVSVEDAHQVIAGREELSEYMAKVREDIAALY